MTDKTILKRALEQLASVLGPQEEMSPEGPVQRCNCFSRASGCQAWPTQVALCAPHTAERRCGTDLSHLPDVNLHCSSQPDSKRWMCRNAGTFRMVFLKNRGLSFETVLRREPTRVSMRSPGASFTGHWCPALPPQASSWVLG